MRTSMIELFAKMLAISGFLVFSGISYDRKDRNAEFKGRRLSDPASMTVTMMTVNRWLP